MAKDKERSLNPAAAALKASKKSALKKSKAAVASQRNERLVKRNPERLQRQIDDLKATESAQGGVLKPRDKQHLEQLERDVRRINKARDAAGISNKDWHENSRVKTSNDRDARRTFQNGERGDRGRGRSSSNPNNLILGKRRRSNSRTPSPSTDEDVRRIPMPRDTPPPVPPRQRHIRNRGQDHTNGNISNAIGGADLTLPQKPKVVAQTTYSSAPKLRDLTKEATARFVPNAVASKLKARDAFAKPSGAGSDGQSQRLLEPEELDRLEKEGYIGDKQPDRIVEETNPSIVPKEEGRITFENRSSLRTLEDEEAAFNRELQEAEDKLDRDGYEEKHTTAQHAAKENNKFDQNEARSISKVKYPGQRQPRFAEVEDVEDETWS